MKVHHIPHREIDILPALVRDYLNSSPKTAGLAAFTPDMSGLEKAVGARTFDQGKRNVLKTVLLDQIAESKYASDITRSQIELLGNENTFTVTTGHQLCLFGGPMFFLYKIMSAIHVASKMKEKFPDKNFVPVYWMASEDHDFPEVNHVYLKDQKITWETGQTGKVGAFNLEGIETFHDQVQQTLGFPLPQKTLSELRKIYSPDKTLAQATMDFAYWVFAEYGLVVLEPDDKRLKEFFKDIALRELETGFSEKAVNHTSEAISAKGYKTQVSPRGINLFWLEEGKRERIVETEKGFSLADRSRDWGREELFEILVKHPERFSPNVILRPVYQECILPNLAYIGGPGELGYWLQLKRVFEDADKFFPVLLLRDMFYLCDGKTSRLMEACKLSFHEIFLGQDVQIKFVINKEAHHDRAIQEAKEKLQAVYASLEKHASEIDLSLTKALEASKAKSTKQLERIEKKLIQADKRKRSDLVRRIEELNHTFFYNATPRERIDNWLNYTMNPKDFINCWSECCKIDPHVGFIIRGN